MELALGLGQTRRFSPFPRFTAKRCRGQRQPLDKHPTANNPGSSEKLLRSMVQGHAGSERGQQLFLSMYQCQVYTFVPLTAEGYPLGLMASPILFSLCALPSPFSTIIITFCIKKIKINLHTKYYYDSAHL